MQNQLEENLRREAFNRASEGLPPKDSYSLKAKKLPDITPMSLRKPTKGEKAAAKRALNNLMHVQCRIAHITTEFGQVDNAFINMAEEILTKVEDMRGYINSALQEGWWEHFVGE